MNTSFLSLYRYVLSAAIQVAKGICMFSNIVDWDSSIILRVIDFSLIGFIDRRSMMLMQSVMVIVKIIVVKATADISIV